MVVKMTSHHERSMLRRNEQPERRRRVEHRTGLAALTQSPSLTLGQRSKDGNAVCITRLHRGGCMRDSAEEPTTASTPDHRRVAQYRKAKAKLHLRGQVGVVGIGGESVDVRRSNAGILRRRHDRFERHAELALPRDGAPLCVGALANADDDSPRRASHPPPPYSTDALKTLSQADSRGWNTTPGYVN